MRRQFTEEDRARFRIRIDDLPDKSTDKQLDDEPVQYSDPIIEKYCNAIITQGKKVLSLTEDARIEQYVFDSKAFFGKAMKVARAAEMLALRARYLPTVSGIPGTYRVVEEMLAEVFPAEIGFTEERWFSIRIPMLLPKKEKAKREYLNGLIYPVLQKYFVSDNFLVPRFGACVIIYRHVYAYDRPARMYRDHDNIEVNQITDALAMYVMRDDGPTLCSHYHCMARAPENRTEVYVIPKEDFVKWLSMEPGFPEEGVKLFDPPEYFVENHM